MINVIDSIKKNQLLSKQLKIVLLILSKYNCRAKEVLSAKRSNFYPDIHLILKGAKRSQDVIIRDTEILHLISSLPITKEPLLFPAISYRLLYSTVKKNYSHLFVRFKTKKNYKVTHGFRYFNAQFTKDENELKAVLHHNSKLSGHFYNPKVAPKK